MSGEITPEIAAKLEELRAPFPAEYIGKLPRVNCGACSANKRDKHCDQHRRAMCPTCKNYVSVAHTHLDYVGHAEITDRLLKSDPTWTWKPMYRDVNPQVLAAAVASGNPDIVQMVLDSAPPKLDQHGGLWIWLTVHGVTRPGYGDAVGKTAGPTANKEIIGDAIRNASMRFGLGLDLWSKSDMGEREIAAAMEREMQDRAAEQPQVQRPESVPPQQPQPPAGSALPAPDDLSGWKKHVVGLVTPPGMKPDIPALASIYQQWGDGKQLKDTTVELLQQFAAYLQSDQSQAAA